MLDGNRPVLSGGFGADVTAVNESPLRLGRDGIHRVPVEIPCLALLQSCLFTQHSPAWKAGGAVHRERGAQHLLKFLIQISCPPPLQHRCTWRSRYHLCGPIPLQLWAFFFLSCCPCTMVETFLCPYTTIHCLK